MADRNISLGSMVRQIEEVVSSDVDGEKVMMSVEKGEYFGLEPIGSRIWDMLEHPVRVADIIDRMVAQYDVARETCERDVLAFLEELSAAGIVQVEG